MKPRTELRLHLYDVMVKRGYTPEFSLLVTMNLNTDWTAQRMLGYLNYYDELPMEEIVDEMLSILNDRNRIIQKHQMEETNIRYNEFLNTGLEQPEDQD